MPATSVTREQMRRLDELAIRDFAIPGLLLMENAGRGAAEQAGMIRQGSEPVMILCGKGNNGGDGFVIARHLHNRRVPVEVYFVGNPDAIVAQSDAGINREILLRMGIPVRPIDSLADCGTACSLIVDALLGTGLSGDVRSPVAGIIEQVNRRSSPVLAVDIPSGLDCNTGEVLGVAVRADRTVTFGLPKQGFHLAAGPAHTGEVVVVEISLPRELIEQEVGR